MYIDVVQPGETLADIARRTGASVAAITAANGLVGPNVTTGQALLIPSNRYVVRQGDTLWNISARTGIPLPALERANPGARNTIYPGRIIRLPEPPRYNAEVIGYLPLTDPGVTAADIEPWARSLTWVAIFAYLINDDGTLPPLDDTAAIQATYNAGARPLMSIANMRQGGAYDPELARRMFTEPDVRQAVISNVLRTVEAKNYAGVDADIENVPAELRDGYVDFLSELKDRLGDRPLNVAVPPKYDEYTFAYARGHDYAGIGRVADRVFLMNYEFHWVGGPPGPIAPLPQIRRVMQYAASLIPRGKLLNGLSTTAYDWELPDTPENRARPVPDDAAVQLAIQSGVPIRYNESAETPWFRYRADGHDHEVWFEDARSLLAKLRVVRDVGLGGVGVWHLGALNSQLVTLLGRLLTVQR